MAATPTSHQPAAHSPGARLRVGVVKYASCDGCQLTLLDLEDELLDIVERFDLIEFQRRARAAPRDPTTSSSSRARSARRSRRRRSSSSAGPPGAW